MDKQKIPRSFLQTIHAIVLPFLPGAGVERECLLCVGVRAAKQQRVGELGAPWCENHLWGPLQGLPSFTCPPCVRHTMKGRGCIFYVIGLRVNINQTIAKLVKKHTLPVCTAAS